jgi:hypothetical protein
MNGETPTQLVKPAVTRVDVLTLSPIDCWIYRDWTSHPTAQLWHLQCLPKWELIKKHGL